MRVLTLLSFLLFPFFAFAEPEPSAPNLMEVLQKTAKQKGPTAFLYDLSLNALKYTPELLAALNLDALMPSICTGIPSRGHIYFPARMVEEPGIHLRNPNESYGTGELVGLLQSMGRHIYQKYPGGFDLVVGDLSLPTGGKFRPHGSHQNGRDVDLRYFQKGFSQKDEEGAYPYVTPSAQNLDLERTFAMLEYFYKSGEVDVIFMDWRIQKMLYDYARKTLNRTTEELAPILSHPYARSRQSSMVRHAKNHYSHLHVRVKAERSQSMAQLWPESQLNALIQDLNMRRTGFYEVRIESGDTLGAIAHRHKVTIEDLQRWNKLGKKAILHPGRKLRIYAPKETLDELGLDDLPSFEIPDEDTDSPSTSDPREDPNVPTDDTTEDTDLAD